MSPACASLHRPGLTLLEVLVVMAIIGLLAALLLPVLPLVRSRVDLSRCAGQMNQFGGAITAYGADWNGALPSRRMPCPSIFNTLSPCAPEYF